MTPSFPGVWKGDAAPPSGILLSRTNPALFCNWTCSVVVLAGSECDSNRTPIAGCRPLVTSLWRLSDPAQLWTNHVAVMLHQAWQFEQGMLGQLVQGLIGCFLPDLWVVHALTNPWSWSERLFGDKRRQKSKTRFRMKDANKLLAVQTDERFWSSSPESSRTHRQSAVFRTWWGTRCLSKTRTEDPQRNSKSF